MIGRWLTPVRAALIGALILSALIAAVALGWLPPGGGPAPGASPWWAHEGIINCGFPAEYRAHDQVRSLGDCAGLLGEPAHQVSLRVGDKLDLKMSVQTSSSGQLVPIYPLPTISDPQVLALVRTGDGDSSAVYRGASPGTTALTSLGPCLGGQAGPGAQGPCDVLTVTVTP